MLPGVLLVYLIIIGDLLVGTEKSGYNGLITSMLDIHTGDVWYVSRFFVVRLLATTTGHTCELTLLNTPPVLHLIPF